MLVFAVKISSEESRVNLKVCAFILFF